MPSDSEKAVEKIFGEILRDHREARERKAVPEEFRRMFQPMELGGSDPFSFGGLCSSDPVMAVCLKCGAVVYPTALDRHKKFHEDLAK